MVTDRSVLNKFNQNSFLINEQANGNGPVFRVRWGMGCRMSGVGVLEAPPQSLSIRHASWGNTPIGMSQTKQV